MKPALLIIDVQNEYLSYMPEGQKKIALLMMNAALSIFRAHKLPIYAISHSDPVCGPTPDSPSFAYDPSIQLTNDDIRITKNFPNAFKNTTLAERLRKTGRDTLFLCGLSATHCVLATYHGARDLDFHTMLVKDALLAPNAAHTECVESFCDAVNLNVLQLMLESVD